jgi:hypothetical protein
MRPGAGLTAIELMVGLGVALVGLAGASALLQGAQAALVRAGRHAELARAAADAVDQVARDVRTAGWDPERVGVAGLAAAESARLVLHADLDGDGAIDASSAEVVTWRRAAAGTLQRMLGAQTLPMVSHVPAGGFVLAYRDADGTELDPAAPDTAVRARVVTVGVTARDPTTRWTVTVTGGARLLNPAEP